MFAVFHQNLIQFSMDTSQRANAECCQCAIYCENNEVLQRKILSREKQIDYLEATLTELQTAFRTYVERNICAGNSDKDIKPIKKFITVPRLPEPKFKTRASSNCSGNISKEDAGSRIRALNKRIQSVQETIDWCNRFGD